jgi:hypothetical protein
VRGDLDDEDGDIYLLKRGGDFIIYVRRYICYICDYLGK